MTVRSFTSTVWTVSTFDFDGSGPENPDLVVSQSGGVYRWHQGNWSVVGGGTGSGLVVRLTTFDPDGAGPIEPWLIAAGEFTRIGGVEAFKIAAFYEGSWHPLPNHIGSHVYSLSVAENLPYSNSPQLLVSCMTARPSVSRFGLCDSAARINGDAPTRSRQPEGQVATFDVVPGGDELTFRWYKGDTALVDGATAHGSDISGVYGPRLTISNVRPQDAGEYHAAVFNPLGEARSRDVSLSLGCATDFNLDDSVDVADYLDFVSAFAASDADADFNADRTIDFFDYLDFVNQFAAGC